MKLRKKEIVEKRPIYFLSAARQITDSGFGNWEITSMSDLMCYEQQMV